MSTLNDIDRLLKQTKRYWYEDGISDAAMGGFLLLIGLLFVAESLTPQGSPLWWLWGMAWPVFLIGGGLAAGWAVRRFKSRVTWRRTGFVDYERKGRPRLARVVGTVLVAAAVAAGVVVVSRNMLSMMTVFGMVFLVAFAFVGYRVGLWRYLWLGLWCLILGLVAAALPLTMEQDSALFFIGTGLALLLAGWLTWQQYNRSAPSPSEADDGAKS